MSWLNVESRKDVRRFTAYVTLVAILANSGLQYVLMPPPLADYTLFPSVLITMIIAAPMAMFVGERMREVHDLNASLRHAVHHDMLTGACNRLSFYHRARALEGVQMVVVVVDIDHFKTINDRYGHQAGDTALRQFAAMLERHCRAGDIVARFGGEEFVILLRGVALEQGQKIAERLCRQVADRPFYLRDERTTITASFGLAEVASVSQLDEAIHFADQALYRAKNSGRNRLCIYNPGLDTSSLMRDAG